MFDQILQMVKDHFNNTSQVAGTIPEDKADEVHQEIAAHITNGIKTQATSAGGLSGLLSSLQSSLTSGSPVTNAIEGGLVSSLASKFGLSPAITGAIAASLPGLLQRFSNKVQDPNDSSLTHESITKEMSGASGGGLLGGLAGKL